MTRRNKVIRLHANMIRLCTNHRKGTGFGTRKNAIIHLRLTEQSTPWQIYKISSLGVSGVWAICHRLMKYYEYYMFLARRRKPRETKRLVTDQVHAVAAIGTAL